VVVVLGDSVVVVVLGDSVVVVVDSVVVVVGDSVVVVVVVVSAAVTNVSFRPSTVPPALVATTRKSYGVPGLRPVIEAATLTGLVPEPGAGEQGTEVVYAVDVPYSIMQEVTS
jgi:hypothetical protein